MSRHCAPTTIGNAIGVWVEKKGERETWIIAPLFLLSFLWKLRETSLSGKRGCRVDDAVFTRKGWEVKHQVNIDVGNLELRESLLEPIQFWIFFLSFSFSFSKILNITMNDCNCLKFHVVSNRKGKSYF